MYRTNNPGVFNAVKHQLVQYSLPKPTACISNATLGMIRRHEETMSANGRRKLYARTTRLQQRNATYNASQLDEQ